MKEPPIFVTTAYEHNQVIVRTSDEEVVNELDQLVKELDVKVPQENPQPHPWRWLPVCI